MFPTQRFFSAPRFAVLLLFCLLALCLLAAPTAAQSDGLDLSYSIDENIETGETAGPQSEETPPADDLPALQASSIAAENATPESAESPEVVVEETAESPETTEQAVPAQEPEPAEAAQADELAGETAETLAVVLPDELVRTVRETRLSDWADLDRPFAETMDLEWGEAIVLTDVRFVRLGVRGRIQSVSETVCKLDQLLVSAARLLEEEGATEADLPEGVWSHYGVLAPLADGAPYIQVDLSFNRQTDLPLALSFTLVDKQLPGFLPALDRLLPDAPMSAPFEPPSDEEASRYPEDGVLPLMLYRQQGDLVIFHARYEAPTIPDLPLNVVTVLFMDNLRETLGLIEDQWPEKAALAQSVCAEHVAGLEPSPWRETASHSHLKTRQGRLVEDISGVWRTAGASTTIVLDLTSDEPFLVTTAGDSVQLSDVHVLENENAVEVLAHDQGQTALLRYEAVHHPLMPERFHLRQVLQVGERSRVDDFFRE